MLAQLQDQLQRLEPAQYKAPLAVLNHSSIGAHTRHIIEFYQCLLQGAARGVVNYDARERHLAIQENLDYTLFLIQEIRQQLEQGHHNDAPLQLALDYGGDHLELVPTNFLREEVYLIEHSVHHFALIRIGLQEAFPGIRIDQSFGVAYSTLAFRQQCAPQPSEIPCAS